MAILFYLTYGLCSVIVLSCAIIYFLYVCNLLAQQQGKKYGRDAQALIIKYMGKSTAFPQNEPNPIKKLCKKKIFHM